MTKTVVFRQVCTLKKDKRYFQFGPIEKRDQITFPQLFTLGWKVQGQYLIWFIL